METNRQDIGGFVLLTCSTLFPVLVFVGTLPELENSHFMLRDDAVDWGHFEELWETFGCDNDYFGYGDGVLDIYMLKFTLCALNICSTLYIDCMSVKIKKILSSDHRMN